MGLRINTNISSITALRSLRVNERNQAQSLERLSTGLRINKAGDDPSGLIISEQLRAQLRALDQAVENSTNAANLIDVADAAMQQVSDLLVRMNDAIVFALNTGGSSPDQIAAEQEAIDNSIAAIERIGSTTRYSDRNLLNGNTDYLVVSDRPQEIQNLTFRSVNFPNGTFTQNFTIEVERVPEQAEILISNAGSLTGATIRLTGGRGTQDVTVVSGATASGIARAINSVAGFTGVWASGSAANVLIRTEDYGREQHVRIEVIEGAISGTANILQDTGPVPETGPFTVGEVLFDRGREGAIIFDGQRFEGQGLDFSILTRVPIMEFGLNPDLFGTSIVSGATFNFEVADTGLTFQLNELARPTDRMTVGMEAMVASELGFEPFRDVIEMATANGISPFTASGTTVMRGGFLHTLRTGAGNDLVQNPGNAANIIKAAINQVNVFRAYLGSVSADNIRPNIDQLGVHIENLTAAMSDIRDLDFAEETSNFVKSQILFQSSVGVLASANAVPQQVLTLLGL